MKKLLGNFFLVAITAIVKSFAEESGGGKTSIVIMYMCCTVQLVLKYFLSDIFAPHFS